MAKTKAKAAGATTVNSDVSETQDKLDKASANGKAKASEIDDIFAGGSSTSAKNAVTTLDDSTTSKKSKKQKRKREEAGETAQPKDIPEQPAKTAEAPVTVVDTSKQKEKAVKVAAQPAAASSSKKRKQSDKSAKEKAEEEDELFKDSRGTSSRRKTDDGLNIYSANELGISEAGGDTPLCPFDCECCF